MALTRRGLLRGGVGLGALGMPGLGALGSCAASGGARVVIVAARGGWDPTFSLDPKPGVDGVEGPEVNATGVGDDVEEPTTIGGIPLATNAGTRPAVTRFFARHAARSVVINGISVGSIAHVECVRRMWTGSLDPDAPDLGAIAGTELGGALPIGYLDVGSGAVSGRLAGRTARLGWSGQAADLGVSSLADVDLAAIARWRARRAARLDLPSDDASAVLAAPALGAALHDLALDPDDPVDACVRALAGDLCAAVYLDPDLSWDTHDDNADQNACHEALYALLDDLADGLSGAGLLDRTLVVVLSEMGRPPWRNAMGGKDHWPVTSALVFGAGLPGGRVLGGTSDGLGARPVDFATGRPTASGDPIRPSNLLAGALDWIGVDPSPWFPDDPPLGLG